MAIKTIKNEELMAGVEQLMAEGGKVKLRVKGMSMRPFLRDGVDVVELAPIDASRLKNGMVVLFRWQNAHILHRIRTIDGDRLVMKGDGNYRITETAKRADVAAFVSNVYLGRDENRAIGYASPRWKMRTCRSLCCKTIRTFWYDLKRAAKRMIGY